MNTKIIRTKYDYESHSKVVNDFLDNNNVIAVKHDVLKIKTVEAYDVVHYVTFIDYDNVKSKRSILCKNLEDLPGLIYKKENLISTKEENLQPEKFTLSNIEFSERESIRLEKNPLFKTIKQIEDESKKRLEDCERYEEIKRSIKEEEKAIRLLKSELKLLMNYKSTWCALARTSDFEGLLYNQR